MGLFRILVLLLLLGPVGVDCSRAQEQATPARTPSFALGLQVLPISGISARLAIDRVVIQIAGLPTTPIGIDEKNIVGARVAYKVAQRSSYNVFLSTSLDLFISRRIVSVQFAPEFEAERAIRADQLYAVTVGAESFLGSKISLIGEAGVGYRRDGVENDILSPDDDGIIPMLGIGLHYYF